MAQTSYPFDSQTTTEDQYSALFSRLVDTGVVGEIGDNDLECFGDSSGMQVKIRAGSAVVRGHYYTNDAQITQSIAAAAGSTRWDWIVLKLDPTANSIVVAVVQGTPGAGVPALTQGVTGIYHMPLALVEVGAGVITIASNKVTDKRPWGGNKVGVWSTALRPASPVTGQLGYNTTTSRWEYYTGVAWANLVSDDPQIASGSSLFAFGAGALSKTNTITFPVGRFSTAPSVVTQVIGSAGNTARIAHRVVTVSTTQCTVILYNEDGDTVTGNVTVHWIAVNKP